jgi:predicted protein tyrosine phosphatase
VITIQGPDIRNGLRFHKSPHPDHLVLRFIDLDFSPPPPYDENPNLQLASKEQVESALEFGKNYESLLIHCHAGVSRSTGIALAIIADRLGEGNEQEALNELLRIRPIAVPNLHVIKLADDILSRSGALIDAVLSWDNQRPDNLVRRIENRKDHFIYYNLPKTVEPDLWK